MRHLDTFYAQRNLEALANLNEKEKTFGDLTPSLPELKKRRKMGHERAELEETAAATIARTATSLQLIKVALNSSIKTSHTCKVTNPQPPHILGKNVSAERSGGRGQPGGAEALLHRCNAAAL